jgi:hypothetical protein
VVADVLELDELLELELHAEMSRIAATAAAMLGARRGTRRPAPLRLRTVMKPPGAVSGPAGARRCGLRECTLAALAVPCQENRSDVCVCQCPETPRKRLIPKRYVVMSSDLY